MNHQKRTYRSAGGCVICGAKSSSSRFTESTRYEEHFFNVFELEEERTGQICNACVLLVKRWDNLDPETKATKSWQHMIDARKGPGSKSICKIKKMISRRTTPLNGVQLNAHAHAGQKNQNRNQQKTTSLPERFKYKHRSPVQIYRANERMLRRALEKKFGRDYERYAAAKRVLEQFRKDHPISKRFKSNPASTVSSVSEGRSESRFRGFRELQTCSGIVLENWEVRALIFEPASLRPCQCEDLTAFCRFVRQLIGARKQERNICEEKEIMAEDDAMDSGINSGPQSSSAGSPSTLHSSSEGCPSLPTADNEGESFLCSLSLNGSTLSEGTSDGNVSGRTTPSLLM